ncbi:hypothetical protein A8924_5700 [Saccharopolyspora erythraea NRRL 2338]|uniref:Uncharacterized protein n=1 Tax=Saccharopolyspora erythraea (strain ATCC 11635 / DSM 40517 / JCM 4748 / NBRC 13426 / NCIMB 8594 / NRRL 2338) TaxID=405948 RepID=A4FKI2_SACEN|nr:hypothetical protein [Saccharopolyspora erythraea]EQD84243.1 hypothetical protein N599_21000 [Saccharopolyspora erythraea D]PFG98195.1 hypothetical protein A8924_5700 [Saccharopolyspora erythraea NRRL 2338]QRK88295.1 hypothetical protein JQX30_26920 [Saccharopolyspora erythraea]CAM04557.1 hypothetical protein SACE_5318 [Saccharopolyspora erythraea NRRL 2338]
MISAVLCLVLDLVTLYAVASSFLMSPRGPWDDDVLTAIQVSSFAGGLLAVLGGLLRTLPVARRWLSWWWFLPPMVLLLAAIARFGSMDIAYPS